MKNLRTLIPIPNFIVAIYLLALGVGCNPLENKTKGTDSGSSNSSASTSSTTSSESASSTATTSPTTSDSSPTSSDSPSASSGGGDASSSNQSGGGSSSNTPDSCSLPSGTGSALVASKLMTGYYGWDATGVLVNGSMPNHGTFNLATTPFTTAGVVSSLTGPALSQVCSNTQIFGASGTANCVTHPSLTLLGNLSWGSTNTASTKTLTVTMPTSGSSYVRISFSGPGTSGFILNSVAGLTLGTTVDTAGGQVFALDSTFSPSQTVSILPKYVDGTTKTMTLTAIFASGQTQEIPADVAFTDPISAIGSVLARFRSGHSSVTSIASSTGTALCSWTDDSGNGYHATNASSGNCPKAVSGVYASGTVPSVRFYDGTARWLDIQTLSLTKTSGYTVVAAFKYRGVLSGRTIASYSQNWLAGSYTGAVLNFYNTDSLGWVGTAPAMSTNTLYTTISIDNGTNSYFYVNGVDRTSGTKGTGANPGTLSIGGRGMYNEYADSDVAEIMIFGKPLNISERAAVDTYISSTY